MEQEIIIYFKLKKAPKADKKTQNRLLHDLRLRLPWYWRQWRKSVDMESRTLSCQGSLAGMKVITYSLPPLPESKCMEDDMRKRIKKQIARLLFSCQVPYMLVYAEELEECLGVHTQVNDRFRLGMAEALMASVRNVEEVLLIEGEEDPFSILDTVYKTLNRLFIITQHPGRYEEFAQMVWEDTGLIAACQDTFAGHIPMKGIPLVIDMHAEMQMLCQHIPRRAVYADMCPTRLKKRSVSLKRSDVNYIDFRKFLDSY